MGKWIALAAPRRLATVAVPEAVRTARATTGCWAVVVQTELSVRAEPAGLWPTFCDAGPALRLSLRRYLCVLCPPTRDQVE